VVLLQHRAILIFETKTTAFTKKYIRWYQRQNFTPYPYSI